MSSSKWRVCAPLPPLIFLALATVIFAAYACLLVFGRWQSDEYILFANLRRWGWAVMPSRLAYSPRPFSELVLALYGEAVLRTGRPLILSFLASAWGGVLLALWSVAALVISRGRLRAAYAACLALAPFVLLLLTEPITEMFYWPVAAAAYLPTYVGAMVLLWLSAGRMPTARRAAAGLALLVVATSSEVGSMFALAFAAAAALLLRGREGVWWWLVPGLASASVIVAALVDRAGIVEAGAQATPYAGHLARAAGAALLQFTTEVARPDAPLVLAARCLMAIGLVGLWHCVGTPRFGRLALATAAAALASAYLSLLASYYHYGTGCCERQQTLRGGYIILALIVAAGFLAGRAARLRAAIARPGIAALLLIVSLAPVIPLLPDLVFDLTSDDAHLAVAARTRTWRSASRPGDGMVFYRPPANHNLLIQGTSLPLGTYTVAPGSPPLIRALGPFFHKREIRVCDPWQTDRAWIIGGRDFAACPDG